jgi:hypothetical protein
MYDGIGEAVMLADAGFDKYADMDNSALIVILSDGMENKSVEYNKAKIAEIVKDRQDGGRFTFTFLGCSDYIVQQATAIHIPWGNTTVWQNNANGLQAATHLNSVGTRSYMSSRTKGETACSGFYEQPNIDIVHVTGIEDFADKSLFPDGPPLGVPTGHFATCGLDAAQGLDKMCTKCGQDWFKHHVPVTSGTLACYP